MASVLSADDLQSKSSTSGSIAVEVKGFDASLLLVPAAGEKPEQLAERTNHWLALIERDWDALTHFVAKSLLKLKNENWRKTDEPEMKAAELAAQLVIKDMELLDDNSVTLFMTCGEVFWGHDIQVEIASTGKMQEATLLG